jgi:hypothetical protein
VRFDTDAWFKAREACNCLCTLIFPSDLERIEKRAAKGNTFAQRLLEQYQVELVKKALLQSTERRKPT